MRTKPYQAAIALFDEVELLDVAGPISVLSSAGRQWNFQPFKIDLVANRQGPISTRSALTLEAKHSAAAHPGCECLIVPGGYGARHAGEDAAFLAWLRRAASGAELVAAIGNGVWLLAQAGLLGETEIAASPGLATEISRLCPSARPNSKDALCSSGKFLSARQSALGLDLSCEIVARCFGKKLASSLSAELGIDWSGELGALEIVPSPLLPK
ncbi:MAG TPA: DJ-1/PfpI family protein [Polyangiaceae bacterium]|nr:DJ-1/PfpI family protein [Polyangiaceae bacterium]